MDESELKQTVPRLFSCSRELMHSEPLRMEAFMLALPLEYVPEATARSEVRMQPCMDVCAGMCKDLSTELRLDVFGCV